MTDKELLQAIAPALKGIGELPKPIVSVDSETEELAAAFIRVLHAPRVRLVDEKTAGILAEIQPAISRIKSLSELIIKNPNKDIKVVRRL